MNEVWQLFTYKKLSFQTTFSLLQGWIILMNLIQENVLSFSYIQYVTRIVEEWNKKLSNLIFIPQENLVYLEEIGTYIIIVTWEMPQILVLWGVNT